MVCSYACRFFSDSITAEHIDVAIDQILTETGVDMEHTSCATDKALSMLVTVSWYKL